MITSTGGGGVAGKIAPYPPQIEEEEVQPLSEYWVKADWLFGRGAYN